jgi:hypothetical protein
MEERWLGAFWSAGEAEVAPGLRLAVDQPCALLFDLATRTAVVADPMQTLTKLRLGLGGIVREVALPEGGEAGRSVRVTFS